MARPRAWAVLLAATAASLPARAVASGSSDDEDLSLPLLFFALCLVLGAVIKHAVKYLSIPIPYTVLLMLAGVLLGGLNEVGVMGAVGRSIDGYASLDPHLLLTLFLPALIFESAFSVNFHIIYREIGQALVLAGPGVLISAGLIGTLARYVFPYGWGWYSALMFGFILSATDPVAVVALLREIGASKRLATLIEAESLLNDGTAFVFFNIMFELVKGEDTDASDAVKVFFRLSLGGPALGMAVGVPAVMWLTRVFNDAAVEITITFASAYFTFWLAESETAGLHVSGVLAVVVLGLYMSKMKTSISPQIEHNLHNVWEFISYMANTVLFILSGVIVVQKMVTGDEIHVSDLGYLLLLYAWIHAARFATVACLYPIIRGMGYGLDPPNAFILVYGGLRGAIGLALALIVDLEPENVSAGIRDRVLFHTAGIVFLTLLVNGSTTGYWVRRLGLEGGTPAGDKVFLKALTHLRHDTAMLFRSLRHDHHYNKAKWREIAGMLPEYGSVLSSRPGVKDEIDETGKHIVTDGIVSRRGSVVTAATRASEPSRSSGGVGGKLYGVEMARHPKQHHHHEESKVAHDSGGGSAEPSRNAASVKSRRASLKRGSSQRRLVRSGSHPTRLSHLGGGGGGGADDGSGDVMGSPHSAGSSGNEMADVEIEYMATGAEEAEAAAVVDPAELRGELSHRLVTAMKASYLHRFEVGKITRRAVSVLVDAAETALDEANGRELEVQWGLIMHYFDIPRWMQTVQSYVPSLGNSLLYNRLAFSVELAAGFLEATEAIDAIEKHFPEFGEYNVVDDLKRECIEYRKRASDTWNSILQSYPEVYRAIQTKHAAQHILVSEKMSIDTMFRMGVLEEREMAKMNALVDKGIYTLDRMRPTDVRHVRRQELLRDLPFYSDLSRVERAEVAGAPVRLFNPGEVLFRDGEYSDGVHVIVRGFVNSNGRTRSTHDMIGLWSFLTGKPNMGDRKATTYVQTVYLGAALMDRVMGRKQAAQRVWKLAAADMIRAAFAEQLSRHWQGRSTAHAMHQVDRASLLLTHSRQLVHVRSAALLLTGQAMELKTRRKMVAPHLHLGQSRLHVAGGSRLLVFKDRGTGCDGGTTSSVIVSLSRAPSPAPAASSPPAAAAAGGEGATSPMAALEADKERERVVMQSITRHSGGYRVRHLNRRYKGRNASQLHYRSGMSGLRPTRSQAGIMQVLESSVAPDSGALSDGGGTAPRISRAPRLSPPERASSGRGASARASPETAPPRNQAARRPNKKSKKKKRGGGGGGGRGLKGR